MPKATVRFAESAFPDTRAFRPTIPAGDVSCTIPLRVLVLRVGPCASVRKTIGTPSTYRRRSASCAKGPETPVHLVRHRPLGLRDKMFVCREAPTISPAVAAEVAGLPNSFHRDPADRILVATAGILDATLLARDPRIVDAGLLPTLT